MGTHALAAAHVLAAAKSTSSSSSLSFLLIIVVVFGLLYFVMIRPQRNRQRAAQQQSRQVGNGSRIRTTAGMYGTIVDSDDDNVLVEFAPGVQIKMMRRAIMNVVPDDEPDGLHQTVVSDTSFDDSPAATDADADKSEPTDKREDLSI
jgi:preprotein translocase subunit YajC